MSELGQFAFGMAFGLGALGFFFGPIGKALAARLGGKKLREAEGGLTTGEMTAERMAAMEDRIADLEAERGQLEERLDFAERMLARGGEETRPVGPGQGAG
jgi:hypothetical protein